MGIFKKKASIENCKEFRKVFKDIRCINKQPTLQETDMLTGFLLGITYEKRRQRKITENQKVTLEEMIESAWKERREELENEDVLEEQLAEQVEEFFKEQL